MEHVNYSLYASESFSWAQIFMLNFNLFRQAPLLHNNSKIMMILWAFYYDFNYQHMYVPLRHLKAHAVKSIDMQTTTGADRSQ